MWLLLTFLFLGTLPACLSIPTYRTSAQRKLPSRPPPTVNVIAAPPAKPEYDCSGNLETHDSEVGRQYIEQAIDEALAKLRTCQPCREMFKKGDETYAIKLLEKLRRNKVFIITANVPKEWKFSNDYKKLWVLESEKIATPGAQVIDLSKASSGEMKRPCIYVNSTGFIATGGPADNYAVYTLNPRIQRAVAILHELGHVAGILQPDGPEGDEERKGQRAKSFRKSAANTNCVRLRCISCNASETCPNIPEPLKKERQSRPIR